jgi:DNA polymerase elongation subunit (family B)
VTANALYGFTGAAASPLQCVPLADSCLALGAASCRRAVDLIPQLAAEGALGEAGARARVIYGQTDSLFVVVPGASVPQVLQLGELAARLVSEHFPDPIELKFEQVLQPFLLLHVNRYAGR